jgi:hypothetical protein
MKITTFNTTPTDDLKEAIIEAFGDFEDLYIKAIDIVPLTASHCKVYIRYFIDGKHYKHCKITDVINDFDNPESADTLLKVLEIFSEEIALR